MNRADPDCGTTFSWVTRAMGPRLGWLGGWAIVVADVIVMANLAQIAGLYTLPARRLAERRGLDDRRDDRRRRVDRDHDRDLRDRHRAVARARRSACSAPRSSRSSLFAVVALVAVATGNAGEHAVDPSLSWFNPLQIDSFSALVSGVLIAVFIYWGWDSTRHGQRGEPRTPTRGPARRRCWRPSSCSAIYVIVSIAAQAYDGTQVLIDNPDDVLSVLGTEVFGSPLDKILIIAVLTSAAASTQTTILPTARTSLSMARAGAMPASLGARAPALPHAARLDDPDGRPVDRLVRRADDRLGEHPVRLDRRARPDDRLLLRADRLRLHDLLPPPADAVAEELPADRRRADARRADAARRSS